MVDRSPVPLAEIMAKQTERGGWTKRTLAKWGVPWPPPKGWKVFLLEHGAPYGFTTPPPVSGRVVEQEDLGQVRNGNVEGQALGLEQPFATGGKFASSSNLPAEPPGQQSGGVGVFPHA